MKINIFYILFAVFFFASCGEEDPDVYPVAEITDTKEDFELISLDKRNTSYVLPKLMDGQTLPLGAEITYIGAPKSSSISYTIEVVSTTGNVGSGIILENSGEIAAGSLKSTLPISINLDEFEVGVPQSMTLKIVSSDAPIVDESEVTYSFAVICPSDLAGNYSTTASGKYGEGGVNDYADLTSSVSITKLSDGVYEINDMSFGVYAQIYSDASPAGRIQDICGSLKDLGDIDQYGDPFTITGSVNSSTGVLTINWSNTYGDSGNVTLSPQ